MKIPHNNDFQLWDEFHILFPKSLFFSLSLTVIDSKSPLAVALRASQKEITHIKIIPDRLSDDISPEYAPLYMQIPRNERLLLWG